VVVLARYVAGSSIEVQVSHAASKQDQALNAPVKICVQPSAKTREEQIEEKSNCSFEVVYGRLSARKTRRQEGRERAKEEDRKIYGKVIKVHFE
jgi:hypothetical protein